MISEYIYKSDLYSAYMTIHPDPQILHTDTTRLNGPRGARLEPDGVREAIPALVADGRDSRRVDVRVGLDVLKHPAHAHLGVVVHLGVGNASLADDVVDDLGGGAHPVSGLSQEAARGDCWYSR